MCSPPLFYAFRFANRAIDLAASALQVPASVGAPEPAIPAAVAAAAAAAATIPAAAPAAAGAAVAAAEAEQFFDATELPALPLALPAAAPFPESGEGLRFEDSALLYLRYMCRTGDQTVGLLQVGVTWGCSCSAKAEAAAAQSSGNVLDVRSALPPPICTCGCPQRLTLLCPFCPHNVAGAGG